MKNLYIYEETNHIQYRKKKRRKTEKRLEKGGTAKQKKTKNSSDYTQCTNSVRGSLSNERFIQTK